MPPTLKSVGGLFIYLYFYRQDVFLGYVRYPNRTRIDRIPNMNAEQLGIATSEAPWNLTIAGPGSGKSTVIVERAKHLVSRGADPASMAFVTFTNTGAKVLRQRLTEAVGKVGFVGTLHGLCLLILRQADSRWVLIGEEDADAFLQRYADLMGFKGPAAELELARALPDDAPGPISVASRAVRAYRQFMRSEFMLDFDTVLTEGLRFLRCIPCANPWPVWFVDEFQDSSPVDAAIYLAAEPVQLFVVADPDQSIFGFRGARPGNVRDYWADWRFTKHVMSLNYRCAHPICAVANAVIALNPGRRLPGLGQKKTVAATDPDSHVINLPCLTDESERQAVGVFVNARILAGVAANDIAVLCRTNRLAMEMRDHLAGLGIPIADAEGERKPKDWPLLLLILSMIATPNSWAIARLLARLMAKLGGEDPDVAELRVTESRVTTVPASLWAFPSMQVILSLNADLSRYGIGRASHALLAERIRLFRPETPEELISILREPGEIRYTRGVSVLTVHAAKGAEWTAVALPGLDLYQAADEAEMSEERRLAFVGITRARRYLFASCAEARRIVLPNRTEIARRGRGEIYDTISSTTHAECMFMSAVTS